MAEHFSFFDPVQLPDNTYDREYNAQQFTDYFKSLVTTGVMKSEGNQLSVSTNGSNMITKIDTGIAYIRGRYYENNSFKDLTHDTESLGVSRIDRVVIRMDLSTDKRHVLAFVKKGVPSTNPVAPLLTQTPNIYEISLAQVRVVGGQTFIAADAVTDERGIDVICPWCGSNILPNFDDAALEEVIQKVDNSWQLNKWNNANITNLGQFNAERIIVVNQSDWKNDGNVEQLGIYIPINGTFSGIIKATYVGSWGGSPSWGGAEVTYEIGSFKNPGNKLNEFSINKISKPFAKDFLIKLPYIDDTSGNIALPLSRAPGANNPLVVKLEITGYIQSIKNAFDIMKDTSIIIDSTGSPSHDGYPWSPQQDLFTYVGEGKKSNVNALAEKGVLIPQDSSFAEISDGIRRISTGIKSSQGVLTVPAIPPLGSVVVRTPTLPFKPFNSAHSTIGATLRNGISIAINEAGIIRFTIYVSYVEVVQEAGGWYVQWVIRNGYDSTTTTETVLNYQVTE